MSTSEEDGRNAAAEIYAYGMKLLEEHHKNPTDSLTGILVDSVDGDALSEDAFCSFFLLAAFFSSFFSLRMTFAVIKKT